MPRRGQNLPVSPPQSGPGAAVELMPGDVAVGLAGDAFRTLLGSCVCVVLTDPRRTVGTLCHIVHAGTPSSHNRNNSAYAMVAMERMFAELRTYGVNPSLCEAYVYGGGNMFPKIFTQIHVGAANVLWVQRFLNDRGIRVVRQDVGGTGYRKISWAVGAQEPKVETVFSEQGARDAR